MSVLAVAVIEGEESRIRETVQGEKREDKRTEAAVRGIVDSWTEGSQEVGTPEQRDTGILGQ